MDSKQSQSEQKLLEILGSASGSVVQHRIQQILTSQCHLILGVGDQHETRLDEWTCPDDWHRTGDQSDAFAQTTTLHVPQMSGSTTAIHRFTQALLLAVPGITVAIINGTGMPPLERLGVTMSKVHKGTVDLFVYDNVIPEDDHNVPTLIILAFDIRQSNPDTGDRVDVIDQRPFSAWYFKAAPDFPLTSKNWSHPHSICFD